jgi:hypothetical protein
MIELALYICKLVTCRAKSLLISHRRMLAAAPFANHCISDPLDQVRQDAVAYVAPGPRQPYIPFYVRTAW